MSFFQSIYYSLYHVQWIRDQRDAPGKAWSYFLPFIFLTSMILFLPIAWQVPSSVRTVVKAITDSPNDFTVHVQDGILSIDDLSQPYVYTLEEEGRKTTKIVIDTTASPTSSIINYIDTQTEEGILISAHDVQVYDGTSDQVETQTFADVPNFSITKSDILSRLQEFSGMGLYVVLGMIAVGIYLMILAGKIVYILFFSCIFLIVARLTKRNWTFTQLYTVGLYAITVPTVLSTVLKMSGVLVPFVPTFFFVLLVGSVLFVKEEKIEKLSSDHL